MTKVIAVGELPIDVPVVVDPITRFEVIEPECRVVAAIAHMGVGLTRAAGCEAPLVDCGGAFPSDLAGLDLKNKAGLACEQVPYETHTPGEVGWHVDQVAGPDVRLIGHGTPWLKSMLADIAAEIGLTLHTMHDAPTVAATLGDAEPWWQVGYLSAIFSGWWSDQAHQTAADTLRHVNPLATATNRLALGELPDVA